MNTISQEVFNKLKKLSERKADTIVIVSCGDTKNDNPLRLSAGELAILIERVESILEYTGDCLL